MRTWLLGAMVLIYATTPAGAGRTHFGWQYGTELNPERGVEVETWIIDMHRLNKAGGTVDDETGFWWGIVVAVSEHVELAIPIEAEYVDNRDPANPPATNFIRFGGEVRWRPQSPDPIEAGPLTNLFRFGV